jgi:DNA-binding XRE family transcriptional regulator
MGEELQKAYQRAYYQANKEAHFKAVKRAIELRRASPKIRAMGATLAEGRKELGMTQKGLGLLLGRSETVIGYWEQARLQPNVELIAEYLPELAEKIRRAGDAV